ncbi:MAG: PAS domain S-box protein [Candidatus Brocadiaceae bacterium]|nr:PAS domain S-box protein [Candidatus Brocadiaceae bacterium]
MEAFLFTVIFNELFTSHRRLAIILTSFQLSHNSIRKQTQKKFLEMGKMGIGKKITLLLLFMLAIAVANIFVIYQYQNTQQHDAHIMNIAGRQGMLSQKMAKHAFSIAAKVDRENECKKLQQAIELYDKSFVALRDGGNSIPRSMLKTSEKIWSKLKNNLEVVLKESQDNKKFLDAVNYIRLNDNTLLEINEKVTEMLGELSRYKTYKSRIILILLLSFDTFIFFTGYLVTKKIVRPIRELSEVARNVGSGDLSKKIQISSCDEVGEFGSSFNKTVEDLYSTHGKLKQSEEKYHRLIESLQDDFFFYTHDTDGIFTYVSPSIESVLGYFPEEFLTHYSQYMTDNPCNEKATKYTKLSIKGIKQPSYQVELYHKNGTIKTLKVLEVPVFDEKGKVVAIEGIAENITQNKKVENALRTSEERYRVLLENLPLRIFYKDKDLCYVSCNEVYAHDLGIQPEEIAGKTDYDFFPRSFANESRTKDMQVIETGQIVEYEDKCDLYKNEMTIQIIKKPIKDSEGEIVGILGIFWDVTEKIRLQKETMHTSQLVSIGELAATVAHEINNPINGIVNCAQIIANSNKGDKRQYDIAQRIIKEGLRITRIVSTLLAYAKAPETEEKKSFLFKELLSDTLILTAAQLKKEGIRVILNMPQNMARIFVNPHQMQQVFLNIISNARYSLNCKFKGKHDNKKLEISVKEKTVDNCVYQMITFCDYGVGIPLNIIDKVKNAFFTTKPRDLGTGLGLSICNDIIKKHGGKLLINSIEGQFTRITVALPAVKNQPSPPVSASKTG